MTSNRLSGHWLMSEGAAHDEKGRRYYENTTGGFGRAKCSCKAMSGILTSGSQRKAWHRNHKAEIATAAVTGGAVGAGGAVGEREPVRTIPGAQNGAQQ